MTSTQTILTEFGINENESAVYLSLQKYGEQDVPTLREHTGLSRTTIYEAMNTLIAGELVEYRKQGRNAYYAAAHPSGLHSLKQKKQEETKLLQQGMDDLINQLTGSYNLLYNKPGIRFFEGLDGIREVMWDSLTTKEGIIYGMGDLEMIVEHFGEMNVEYTEERLKRGIEKKGITNDSPSNLTTLAQMRIPLTESRVVSSEIMDFHSTGMEIYDGKISYVTLVNDALIGVIIESKQIHEINKNLFNLLWYHLAKPAV